jgi:hypothetical protein
LLLLHSFGSEDATRKLTYKIDKEPQNAIVRAEGSKFIFTVNGET